MPLIIPGNRQASTGYTIDQSIRFDGTTPAYLTKTFSSAGNSKTWTLSFWWKRGILSSQENARQTLFGAGNGSTSSFALYSNHNSATIDGLTISLTGSAEDIRTSQVFRDVAAWYHVVIKADSTQAISTERVCIYINGNRVTDFAGYSAPSQNSDFYVNYGVATYFGYRVGGGSSQAMDGYLAEIVFLDGTATDCNSFGEFNDSNIWIPKDVSGLSFGTYGYYIDGRDSSDLGDDESGNGNDFTTSGMDTSDQKADTPTNNQITFNPLNNQRSGGTPSNGNLDYVGPGTRTIISLTADIPSTGKWAVAFKVAQVSTSSGWQIGISTASDSDFSDAVGSNEDLDLVRMQTTSSDLACFDAVNSSSIDPSLPVTTSDEFWVAVDMDSGKVFLGIYDASDASMKFVANDAGLDGNPATGDNPTVTFTTAQMPRDDVVFSVGSKQTSQYIYLQRSTDVSGTTPTGYTYFENVKDLI